MSKNICFKCGNDLDNVRTSCTSLKCGRELITQHKCECDICVCNIKSGTKVCSKCIKGWHNSELKT